jgi:hypothetical protein
MALPDRPALAPWCRLVEDGSRVLIERGGTLVTLEGGAARALLPRLLPLLDGTRTREELEATLGHAVAPAVDNVLALLAEHQLLVDGPTAEGRPASAAAAFPAAGVGPTTPAAAVDGREGARGGGVG